MYICYNYTIFSILGIMPELQDNRKESFFNLLHKAIGGQAVVGEPEISELQSENESDES